MTPTPEREQKIASLNPHPNPYSVPSNALEAFERIDREDIHKVFFVNGVENDGLYTPVVNSLYAWHQAALKAERERVLDEIEKLFKLGGSAAAAATKLYFVGSANMDRDIYLITDQELDRLRNQQPLTERDEEA